MQMKKDKDLTTLSSRKELDEFIQLANELVPANANAQGRILFALDATASRQATWDHACHLQNQMFSATSEVGNLAVMLCYFRGYQEFQHSKWLNQPTQLRQIMENVSCAAGHTQIQKVLQLGINETRKQEVKAIIYIGDSQEESTDKLTSLAGQLGLLKTPVFIFQEGSDCRARQAFTAIAHLSGGAYHHFDHHSSELLKQLLIAVAIYASQGKPAFQHYIENKGQAAKHLLEQLR